MKNKNEKAPDGAVNEIMRRVAALTSEERSQLSAMGCVLPNLSGSEITTSWGLRCSSCGQLALLFVGDKFDDGFGVEIDQPSPYVPIDMIPWRQDLPPTQIKRSEPGCQHCGCAVALENGKFKAKYLVQVSKFLESRTATEREVAKKRIQHIRAGDIPGSGAAIPTDPYTAGLKTGKISQHYTLSPAAKQDIEAAQSAGMLVAPEAL